MCVWVCVVSGGVTIPLTHMQHEDIPGEGANEGDGSDGGAPTQVPVQILYSGTDSSLALDAQRGLRPNYEFKSIRSDRATAPVRAHCTYPKCQCHRIKKTTDRGMLLLFFVF